MALAWRLVPCLPFPGLLFTVRLTKERVGVFLARRSVQHLVQLVKIYMPCNFEVNLITRLGVIALFSSFFSSPGPKGHVRYCHHLASVRYLFPILIFSSETTWPNGTKLGSKHLCKVLYKVSPFRSIPPTNMATKGNSCF